MAKHSPVEANTILKDFDVNITRVIDVNGLEWPKPGEACEEGYGCNRAYVDLRGYSWADAQKTLKTEMSILHQIAEADDPAIMCEELEAAEGDNLPPTDVGVMATVAALSAARCIPFSSCNGGCFGDQHHETYPVVAFHAKPVWKDILLEAAEEAEVGLSNGFYGSLTVYSDDIWKMVAFARALIARKAGINKLKIRPAPKTSQGDKVPASLFSEEEITEIV